MSDPTSRPAPRPSHRKRLYLIDGSAYIFRAYHALPPMTRGDGTPVNAVYGYSAMLAKLLDDAAHDGRVSHIAVIFDTARQSFRNDIYADYKANRPPPPEDLVPQFALVRDATRAFNVPSIELAGFEADDIIATYARQAREAGADVVIVSSDKDLMQLVGDGVTMFDPMKNRAIGEAEVREKFGVGPDRVVDVQALAGDSTDNVPGVPGIGVKTAAQLIGEYGDLDSLLARAGEIRQPKRRESLLENADKARMSRQLVRLRDDVPLDRGWDDFDVQPADAATLMAFLNENRFKSLVARLAGRVERGEAIAAAPPPPSPTEVVYELVQTEKALAGWIARAGTAGVMAVDTETTSLDAMQARLVGVSLALVPGEACYIPLGHVAPRSQGAFDLGDGGMAGTAGNGGGEAPPQIPLRRALDLLRPLLEDAAVLKIGQNIKYDMLVLRQHGIRLAPVDDTMVMSYVLDAGLHGHRMDELSQLHLGHTPIAYKDVTGKGRGQVTFDQVPLEAARDYAAEDADVTLRLHGAFKPRLLAERLVTVYETMERPLIPVLVEMELAGVRVDPRELARLSEDFARRMGDLEIAIHKLAGREFNIGSPKQLGEILFDEMSLDGGKKTKTGAYGTGADVLEGLAAQGHDLPARVLDWRQLAKLKSTYTDALQQQINPATGRVHTSYAMAAAATGRLASSDPNLQNIPVRTEEGRKIRRAFIAADGCKLLSADYSQIELRLLAHVAGIDSLKQAFKEGVDIHALTASQVFGVPLAKMDAATRRSAKAINFGIIYGISPFGLAQQLGIGQGEARAYIEAYFDRYPGIRDYMERTKEEARARGFVTTIFGRRVHVAGIKDNNPARRSFSERAAVNAPLQGAAADIIKRAMVRIPNALDAAGLKTRMLLQVHDELIFEVPEAELDKAARTVRKVMEAAAHLSVPLTVDTGIGDNWDEAH